MSAETYLRAVNVRPSGPTPMKRKASGREVAAVVHACPACGWESKVCRTLAEARRVPKHVCPAERFEGEQAALVGPRFTFRDEEGR